MVSQSADAIVVITHQSVNVDAINAAQLRRIYSMRQQRWANNTPIVVYVLPSQHVVHQAFSKNILKIFPYKLDRIWNKLTFSGLGVAPKVVSSQAALLEAVKSTPGAIGYIEKVDKETGINVIEISK